MQTQYFCPKCLGTRGSVYLQTDINEDDYYVLQCQYGHKVYATTNQEKHELLGRQAVEAYIDGYFLQSVSTFAASLERCFEWYIQAAFMSKYGLDRNDFGNEKLFNEVWRQVKKQSERQIGMFAAIFAFDNGVPAPLLSSSQSSFRNDIVHNGTIPSPTKAYDFGQTVVDFIQTIRKCAKEKHYQGIEAIRNLRMAKMVADRNLGPMDLSVYANNVPYEINQNDIITNRLSEIIERCKLERMIVRSAPQLAPGGAGP